MDWWKLMAFPLRLASLLLLLLASALLAFVGPPSVTGLGLLVLVVWVTWLWICWRYAALLLRCMAEGVTEPPAFALEMANPFESLPYQPALPIVLRAPLALGACWPGLLVVWGLCAAAVLGVAAGSDVWPRWPRYALAIYCWWLAACALGAAMHRQRAALGYVPVNSPERAAAVSAALHEQQRKRLLDELYQQVRMQRYRSSAELLEGWLAALQPQQAEDEARQVFGQLCRWDDRIAITRLTPTLVSFLLRHRLGHVGLELIVGAERQGVAVQPATPVEAKRLAELARRTGQQRLAERLAGSAT